VVLLERGSGAPAPAIPDHMTMSGDLLPPMHLARAQAVGGTASVWNTIRDKLPGGKYVPLDPIDFEPRDAVPHGGWPMARTELEPWYRAAHQLLGLAPFASDGAPTSHGWKLLPFDHAGLSNSDFHWGSAELYTHELPASLDASPLARLLHHATAVRFDMDGEPSTVHWIDHGGKVGTIAANRVVLAGGAVENARMLLEFHRSRQVEPPFWLGRGFMEHPVDRSLTLESRHPALSPDPGFYAFAGKGARARLVGRIGISDKLLREEGLRNASLRLFAVRHRFVSRHLRNGAHRVGLTPRTTYRILLDLEQAPHPDNRVTLAEHRDRFGRPLAHLHWQWRPDDEAFRQRLLPVIQREFARSGTGRIRVIEGVPLEHGVHHHAGTTRMHHDPGQGVVNADLRVHGHRNLYVVGGSVFPTCGVANPTLTIVALSLRLADQLARG
jgi:hypothetical protein